MSKNKLISLKRIEKDISEITKNPIKGIGIVRYENDFMKYIVNIKLLYGIYEGYCLQLLLTFSENYPVKPPKILIFPNQEFGSTYHHHIFADKEGFKKFCFDLLDNDFLNINEVNTGWNPSYTISSLLLQVQNFLSDPDLPEDHLPSKNLIDYLFNSMKDYVKTFVDENGKTIIHSWEYPYPPMFGFETKIQELKDKNENKNVINNEQEENNNNDLKNYDDNKNNDDDNKINENKSGNIINNFISYLGSFIPYPSFSFFNKKENNDNVIENNKNDNGENISQKSLDNKEENNDGEEKEDNENDNELNQAKNEILFNGKDYNTYLLEEEKRKEEENKKIEEEKRKEEERKRIEEEKIKEEKKKKEEEKQKRLEEIKQNLTCFLMRVNIIDDKDICLGYPLKQLVGLGDKIECVPIPEILSYEGYLTQIAKQDGKLDDYFNVTFKAGNNETYNYWLPIYINEDHFKRNKILILNSFSVLKFGARGEKEYDFKPVHIFEYLPNLLNKMICGMFNEKSYMSEAYIRCYFQYLLLFKKLIDEFKEDFHKYLNETFDNIKKYKYIINKTIVPDLGNLYMLLFFSDNVIDKKIWNALFEENMIRKMYWTFHHFDNEVKAKSIFELYDNNSEESQKLLDLMKKEKIVYYEFIEEYKGNKIYDPKRQECLFSIYERNLDKEINNTPLKGLFAECIEKGIFEKLINIIAKELLNKPRNLNDLFTKQKKRKLDDETKNKVKNRIIDEFPYIYKNEISSDAQNKIDKLLVGNIDLYKYCSKELKEDKITKKNYFSINQVDELMKKIDKKYHIEIVKKLFDVSRDNLLLITTMAQKKMNEKGFMTELENNYGVYMDIENYMKEINQKIKDIQCYKDLFDFMQADIVFKDEDEYQTIIKSYQRAKQKKYIKTIIDSESDSKFTLRTGKDFTFNRSKNSENNKPINTNINNTNRRNNNSNNNWRSNNNNNRNSNIGHNNNFHNHRIFSGRGNINNNNHTSNNNSNNNRRRSNFNSHMCDLDELLGE